MAQMTAHVTISDYIFFAPFAKYPIFFKILGLSDLYMVRICGEAK